MLSYYIHPVDSTITPPTPPPSLKVEVYDSQGLFIAKIFDLGDPPLSNTLYYDTSNLVAGSYIFVI